MIDKLVLLAGCKANLSTALGAIGQFKHAFKYVKEALDDCINIGSIFLSIYKNGTGDYLMANFNIAA